MKTRLPFLCAGALLFVVTATAGHAAGPPDKLELLRLLRGKDYGSLENLLDSYQERLEKDPPSELDVEIAFRTFWIADPSITPLLEEWVQRDPKSWAAYLARARHFEKSGAERRGGKWARETSEEQFRGMEEYHAKAERDALAALDLNPKAIEAYAVLMNIAQGNPKACRELADRAFRFAEASLRIRALHLHCLQPRWGGSHEAMASFARESQAYAGKNPKLAALKGFVAWDMGTLLRQQERFREATGFFDKALQAGDYWQFYRDRGDNYYRLDDYEKALADFKRADELLPQHPEMLINRAYTLIGMGKEDDALREVDLLLRIDPTNARLPKFRANQAQKRVVAGFEVAKAGRFDESIEKYNEALKIAPQHAEAFYWRGRSFLKKDEHDRALSDFEEAIRLDPKHYDSYVNLDFILTKRGQRKRILDYWNRFIELEPKHAEAYLERAGTHRHAGDMEAARADLKKACELGSSKACQIYGGAR